MFIQLGWGDIAKFAPVPEMSLLDDFSDMGISLARQFQRGKRPFLPSASVFLRHEMDLQTDHV